MVAQCFRCLHGEVIATDTMFDLPIVVTAECDIYLSTTIHVRQQFDCSPTRFLWSVRGFNTCGEFFAKDE